MKLRSVAGGFAHYYKFTGVTEIQCWMLQGDNPGSPRNAGFNDKLKNKVPTPRIQGSGLGDKCQKRRFGWLPQLVLRGHGSALPPGYCARSAPCGSISARGCPRDTTHRWAILGPQPPENACCWHKGGGWESRDGFTAAPLPLPPLTLNCADGGAGKLSSEMKAAH